MAKVIPFQGPVVGGPWHTSAFSEMNRKLTNVLGDAAKPMEKLGCRTVGDLMRLFPRRYYSGTESTDLAALPVGETVAVLASVVDFREHRSQGRGRLEIIVSDGHGRLSVTMFANKLHLLDYWSKHLRRGQRGLFTGKVGSFRDQPQLTNPDWVTLDADGHIIAGAKKRRAMATVSRRSGMIGIYPQTSTVPTWDVAACTDLTLEFLGHLDDPWPEWVREEADLADLTTALNDVHRPVSVERALRGRERLEFDEAFSVQLAMARRRALAAQVPAVARPRRSGGLLDAFDARLPFTLTAGQQEVGEEIFTELAQPRPMQRLLQGEVGSGKTLVALRAMLAVIDAGGQVALLAPTEVLASQHLRTLTALLGELADGGTLAGPEQATSIALLTGSLSAATKRETLLRIASGEAGIVIGTHALLQEKVQFAELGLIVVDEQHRFGVEQRAALSAKADQRPHLLVMTATPIPRSVAMTVFGDLETSTLREIPAGRAEVRTTVVDEIVHQGWVERAWERIVEEVGQGRQAFVVCPRISPSDKSAESVGTGGGGRSAVEMYEMLSTGPLAELRVGLVHGQLPTDVKDETMRRFAAGEIDVLVATTVIEVGIDVPNASMMMVCDADRFGVSQLHQLRGRIGRGTHAGVCLLLTTAEAESSSMERLQAVARLRDGFALAEVDLAQRREGDVLGASQAGVRSSLRLIRVVEHADLIQLTRTLAEKALADDPELETPGFADAVTQVEQLVDGEWLERS